MRAKRLIAVLFAGLALAACARHVPPPTAAIEPPSALDTIAFGAPVPAPIAPAAAVVAYTAIPDNAVAIGPAEPPYTLDSGDKLRVVVFGQEGLSNTFSVDAGGRITMPLIGGVAARGLTSGQLAQAIAARLRQGFVREPHVAVEIEIYRPFFILGEVTAPGQYAYVPNMTAETAVAIAGGFTPRASQRQVELTRTVAGQTYRGPVPLSYPLRPGDTLKISERWF